jgi:hypothetical protein
VAVNYSHAGYLPISSVDAAIEPGDCEVIAVDMGSRSTPVDAALATHTRFDPWHAKAAQDHPTFALFMVYGNAEMHGRVWV